MTATSIKNQIRVWGRGNKIGPIETFLYNIIVFEFCPGHFDPRRREHKNFAFVLAIDGRCRGGSVRRPPPSPTAADNTAAAPPAHVPGLHFFYRHHVRSTTERDRARTAADQPRSVTTSATVRTTSRPAVPVWRFVPRLLCFGHATSRPNATARHNRNRTRPEPRGRWVTG